MDKTGSDVRVVLVDAGAVVVDVVVVVVPGESMTTVGLSAALAGPPARLVPNALACPYQDLL